MTAFMSMLPVIELRGGIPFGMALGLDAWTAFIFAFAGSLLPAPFLLLLIRPVLKKLSHFRFGVWLDDKFQIKARAHSASVKKYGWIVLAVFVAVPLPGTGVWSACVIATFLDIRFRRAFPAIALGNFAAGIAIMVLSGAVSMIV